ncbi:MAG: glycoside hydrolase family 88 protein [Planctomycetaceae bacterium]|nr:glycoside hydrolase family 88 protein [Planctomycetaceae bacterium]
MHRPNRQPLVECLEQRAVPATLPLIEVVYLSLEAAGAVTGTDGVRVSYDDSDILRTTLARNEAGELIDVRHELLFDGSDVGLSGDGEDLDALAILPDGTLVISTTGRATVPGVTAEDEDLLRFTPAAAGLNSGLGRRTAGAWSLLFDGSDVGLSSDYEDIDALSILPDGRLVISTLDSGSVPGPTGSGISIRGEDLLVFTPTGIGPTTRGVWAKFFDGSNVGLAYSSERIDALDVDTSDIDASAADAALLHLSTSGSFGALGASGQDEDVLTFDQAAGAFVPGLRLRGLSLGLQSSADIDALHIGPTPLDAVDLTYTPVIDVAGVLSVAQTKLAAHDAKSTTKLNYPSEHWPNSATWMTTTSSRWEAGFYPGALWQMFEHTGQASWQARAAAWTAGLEGRKNDTSTHDLGFVIGNSFGQGYRLTGDPAYLDVVLMAARSLTSRYDPDVGAIRSWNGGNFQVIIDNLMNLELLFLAARHGGTTASGGGSQDLYNMAVSHATTTLANHVRANGSTYHVVDFSPTTGAVLDKYTAQGKSDESTWARGQAWAVYGFTMVYRESGEATFLEAARRTADYFLANLPDDYVPMADFQSPYTDLAHKDSSAAAIAASGLIELSQLETDSQRGQRYRAGAANMLDSLTSPTYLSRTSANAGLLMHGARTYPGENRTYMFGDYYFLEALLRYSKLP